MFALSPAYTGFFSHFTQINIQSFRVGCFVLALLLYGALGSPTPDDPGVLEGAIAGLLVLSMGVSGGMGALRFDVTGPRWRLAAQMFLIFGVSLPLVVGVVGGHAPGLLIRDVIAFLFMGLPLFMAVLVRHGGGRVLYAVLAVGVLFGARAGFDLSFLGAGDKLFYLANMPSVLFAAIFFAGGAVTRFTGNFNIRSIFTALVFVALAGICLYPLVETQQRASLGVFVLGMAVIVAIDFWKHPRRVFILLGFMLAGLILALPELRDIFEMLSRKTDLVGVNMRAAEWAAVWGEISAHPINILVGKGWGATFSSPAVADIEVNFTHGLLSSLLLKTGFIGLGLGVLYLSALGQTLLRSLKAQPVLVVALIGPIAIDVFLYASFKSLDFGLMLLLAAGVASRGRFYGDETALCVETGASVLYSGKDIK